MKSTSIWYQPTTTHIKHKHDNIKADILIIGGGITGLTTAYLLKDNSQKVVLIDKGKIGNGITLASTAKITYLQGIIYQTLAKNFDKNCAKQYLNSQKDAISIIKNIIQQNNISCNFERVDSIVFTLENSGVLKIKQEKEILKKWNINIEDVIDKNIKSGIKIKDSYVFNPLKYLNGLRNLIEKSVDIYEFVLAKILDMRIICIKLSLIKVLLKQKK